MGRASGLLGVGDRDDATADRAALPSTPSPDAAPGPRLPGRRARVWLAAVGVVLLVGVGVTVWRVRGSGPAPLTSADVNKIVATQLAKAQQQQRQTPPDAALAYRRILPSLVTVVAKDGTTPAGSSELGAGVVVNADGSVLTALHVVANGTAIEVHFADGTTANALVKERRADSDIAVLAVDKLPQVVVPAVLGGGAQVGDAVFPVGNPLGLMGTLTAGVVSAVDRTVSVEGGTTLKGLIQFDAAVNPGNSGGPLLDRNGYVIGVVTGLANPSKQPYFVGVGFAVPIATAGGAAGGPAK